MTCKHLDGLEDKIQTLNRDKDSTVDALNNLKCKKCGVGAPDVWNCLDISPYNTCPTMVCSVHLENHAKNKKHWLYFNISTLTTFCFQCKQSDVNCVFSYRMFDRIAESIGYHEPKKRNKKLTGLKNLGNTCYINTALQCISRMLPIQTYLRKDPFLKYNLDESEEYTLIYQFRELIKKFWRGHILISPDKFVSQIYCLSPDYKPKTQQDAQEFIRLFLDDMDCYLQAKTGKRSIISESIKGTLRCELKCHNCTTIHIKEEEFAEISLAVPETEEVSELAEKSESLLESQDKTWITQQNKSFFNKFKTMLSLRPEVIANLYDCLISFFQPQELNTEGNLFYCSACDSKVLSTQQYKIKAFPDILIINLKRFKYSYWGSKISTHVNTPMTLNLSKFSCEDENPTYYLSSIIQHSGVIFKGHYTAFCKDFEFDRWFEYNDKKVIECSEDKVRNAQAYVAIYTKFPAKQQKIISKGSDIFLPKEWLNRYYSLSSPGPINFSKFYCTHSFLNINTHEYDFLGISNEQWEELKIKWKYIGEPLKFKNPCNQCLENKGKFSLRLNFEKDLFKKFKHVSKEYPRFFIAKSWIKTWESFLSSDLNFYDSSKPPGHINNLELFSNSEDIKEGLFSEVDYIDINEDLWKIIKHIYGCDIQIIRASSDIYSESVADYQLSELDEETEEIIHKFTS